MKIGEIRAFPSWLDQGAFLGPLQAWHKMSIRFSLVGFLGFGLRLARKREHEFSPRNTLLSLASTMIDIALFRI